MNAEEDNMRGKQRQAIQQSTIMLPSFDYWVPVLNLSNTLCSRHCAQRDAGMTHVLWNVNGLLLNTGDRDPIVKHFMSRSLILVFAEQPDDKSTPTVDSQEQLRAYREHQAAFEVAHQGLATQVWRREHHLVFALSHRLTRVQTTWLNTHIGKLFDTYYIKDELEVELDTMLEEAHDNKKAAAHE